MKYDFLVAGFPKCGTTTLHNLLQQNPYICLPDSKETFFFSDLNIYKKGKNYLEKHFYGNALPEQMIGGVEPSFSRYAQRVKTYLRDDTKVIFLVRNPLSYLFSYYKMCMSFGAKEWYEAYGVYGGFSGIIREYVRRGTRGFWLKDRDTDIRSAILGGEYIRYVKEYEDIVGKDNITIFLFEDFIKDEKKTAEKIFQLIGVESCEIRADVGKNTSESIMPRNERGRVLLADREYLHHTYMEHRKKISKTGMALCSLYYKYIPGVAAEKISDRIDLSAEKLLRGYYEDSVSELEKWMGRNLMETWGLK